MSQPPLPTQELVHVALVVHDYDEAIAFFVEKLLFRVVEDRFVPAQNKRWVLVAPPGSRGASVLLAKAASPNQAEVVGRQAAGRVFLFLATDDFDRDYARMREVGIEFVRGPATEPYGTVAVFLDLYGNRWDLVEWAKGARGSVPPSGSVGMTPGS